MPERDDADAYRNLLPSLEAEFATLLTRHKEAAEKGEWSYHEFLPVLRRCRAGVLTMILTRMLA